MCGGERPTVRYFSVQPLCLSRRAQDGAVWDALVEIISDLGITTHCKEQFVCPGGFLEKDLWEQIDSEGFSQNMVVGPSRQESP